MSSASELSTKWNAGKYWANQDFETSARYFMNGRFSKTLAHIDRFKRLHLQHWIWNYQLGYALHPKIDVNVNKPLRVGDVAAGNG